MQAASESANRPEHDPRGGIPPSAMYTEPWWRGGYNHISMGTGVSIVNSSSQECLNGGAESNNDQSLSNFTSNEKDNDARKESQRAVTSSSARNCHHEHQDLQHASPILPRSDDCLPPAQPPQLELVGQSTACPLIPYQDPNYWRMMAAYGPYPYAHPQFLGTPHARMPLPLDVTQEPVYVNAKQYQAILRRRQSRAKAELEKKLIKVRKPYLHESRHQHAMRRARATGGRFAKKVGEDDDASNHADQENGTNSALSPQSLSHSMSSSGSETMPSDSTEYWNSSNAQQEAYRNGSVNVKITGGIVSK